MLILLLYFLCSLEIFINSLFHPHHHISRLGGTGRDPFVSHMTHKTLIFMPASTEEFIIIVMIPTYGGNSLSYPVRQTSTQHTLTVCGNRQTLKRTEAYKCVDSAGITEWDKWEKGSFGGGRGGGVPTALCSCMNCHPVPDFAQTFI